MKRFIVIVLPIIIVVALGFICTTVANNKGNNDRENVIPLGKAKEIKTEISFPAGDLNVSTCSNSLAEGLYKYSNDTLKPEVSYVENSGVGYLKIATNDNRTNKNYGNSDSSQWTIKLNKNISNDLTLKFIAGTGNFDLHDCKLKRLDFEMTAGDITFNLKNTSVPNIRFNALAGKAVIDLSGKWNNDLNANIKVGFGEITVKLPANKGIKLNLVGILGEVNAPYFVKQDNIYTNPLYGKTRETLYVDLIGVIGQVNIVLVE